jgi:hypothetical protein
MREMVQFGCSLCISFASFLHARLALYVEQPGERKQTGACVVYGKAALKPARRTRHQKSFMGLVVTAAGLIYGTYQISHTGQAPARVVWMMFAC